jgi:DNA modification methylase
MKPLFDRDGITIYCGNSQELIDKIPIYDMLLTDPPYCNGYKTGNREVLEKFENIAGDDDSATVKDILHKAWRKLKIWRHGYVFGPLTPSQVVPNEVGGTTDLIWDKSAMSAGDLTSPWGVSHENIWFGVKRYTGKRSEKNGNTAARLRRGTVLRASRSGETSRTHPMQKPVELLVQLIEMSSSRDELVFDPFMGAGSSAIAAILERRRFIGMELDPKHCSAAVLRVRQALDLMKKIKKIAK